jgi:uncharacterized coiled-coil protein SlyX
MNELDARITDLEVKFSFVEEHVAQQDREILKLRTQIEKQAEELERLRSENNGDGLSVRGEEKPPHY